MLKRIFSRARFTDKFKEKSEESKKDLGYEEQISKTFFSDEKLKDMMEEREKVTKKEFNEGYNIIKKHPRSVSVFGSTRFTEKNRYYQEARSLANRIARELKYAVVTGGGPGIMEAANRGAYEAGGISIGFTIKLPKEQFTNRYVTDSVSFEYFMTRKTLLFFSAECYVFYPGGFGTFDELFDVLTSIQTRKVAKAPVILVGKKFWTPLLELIEKVLFNDNHTIGKEDMEIYRIVDSEDEAMEIIRKAPVKKE
ncbi:MAG: TIGR00730 family Rossman fold protein [Candidatus Paceibacterota bacterium]